MKNLVIPKNYLAIALSIMLVTAMFQFGPILPLANLLTGIVSAVVTELLVLRLLGIPLFFPSAAIVSGLIIALLVSPQAPFYIIVASSIFAIVGKNLGRIIFKQPLFNPAAAGIFVASLIFNTPVSWWGVSWGYVPLVITLVLVGYLVLSRMKRWAIPLSFLVANFLILAILSPNILISQSLNIFLDPTLIFFSLVMLPEPTTSPNEQKKQIFYGIFVAIAATLLSLPIFNFQFSILNSVDPLIISLLLGNLLFKFI